VEKFAVREFLSSSEILSLVFSQNLSNLRQQFLPRIYKIMKMKIDAVERSDITPLWAENYPKREIPYCGSVCQMVIRIIRDKAKLLTPSQDFDHRLNRMLEQFAIPKQEFEQFEREQVRRAPSI
jgi:hypothetical protein